MSILYPNEVPVEKYEEPIAYKTTAPTPQLSISNTVKLTDGASVEEYFGILISELDNLRHSVFVLNQKIQPILSPIEVDSSPQEAYPAVTCTMNQVINSLVLTTRELREIVDIMNKRVRL